MPGARPPRPLHASMTAGRGWSQGWRPPREVHHLEEVSPKVSLRPRRALVGLVAVAAVLALPAAASAAITPALTVDPDQTTAGTSPATVGSDATFTGRLRPNDVSFSLPAGLLANATQAGGACLISSAPPAACQVGSGTVTAGGTPNLPVSLYLVRRRRPAMPPGWRSCRAAARPALASRSRDRAVSTDGPGSNIAFSNSGRRRDQRSQRVVDDAAAAVELSRAQRRTSR